MPFATSAASLDLGLDGVADEERGKLGRLLIADADGRNGLPRNQSLA
jgi:hypothetical protein